MQSLGRNSFWGRATDSPFSGRDEMGCTDQRYDILAQCLSAAGKFKRRPVLPDSEGCGQAGYSACKPGNAAGGHLQCDHEGAADK